ncbi:ABC transporter permease [Proteiniphilum acetatigenes]|uniref:ABC transporter permease n=1 Tax=Proteiniphilum acetatigenes TaxID=294710 RepID=UPI000365AEA8|nr:ABC transporter permease [Proteiniphilum acetatigenes]SFK85036.1 putative ABC transport system permease protein [Porphyromonadaceae bacterium KH3CP3RA]
MNNLKLAYRNLFRKKQNNLIKILSLGMGLAVGLVLLSKVSFERNYDDFYPENDRIYRIESRVIRNDEPKDYGNVSGAIAPGMKAEVPGVESATRFTGLEYDGVFYTQEKNRVKGNIIMADEYFFDIFPRPMVAGNAKETLSRSMYALISHSLAKKMGRDVEGKVIIPESYPGKEITIGGVFEDIPENSHNRYDVIISMASISQFMWDGSNNWTGNDRYQGFVKLAPGITPESLAPAIRQMQEKNQPLEEMRSSGVELSYTLAPLTTLHSGSKTVKNSTLVLSIIAFSLLLTTVLNYLLIVITALVQRSKEVAVNKCYGATRWHITKLIATETLLHFLLALLLAGLLLFSFRNTVEEILGASLLSLFSTKALFLLSVTLVVLFIVSVVMPAATLQRIPLATVFRNNKRLKQHWKLMLLFVQFGAAAFLLTLTGVVSKQYHFMVNDHPGYDYSNVAYITLSGVDSTRKQTLGIELENLPEVEMISFATTLPLYYMSGNNVFVEGNEQELFNIADMYYADENFLPLMNIPLLAGKNFSESDDVRSAVVTEVFRDRMKTMVGWEDVIGKEVSITERNNRGLSHIVGVIPNIRISSFGNQDTRPAVLHFSAHRRDILHYFQDFLLVKLKKMDTEGMAAINETIRQLLPERDISFVPYADSVVRSYDKDRLFRNTILIGALITLLISLIGLIGYVNNEMSYRTAEIAIRKINGATLFDILKLFATNILYIALPAVGVGCIVSHFVSAGWMDNFSEKWGFAFGEYLICGLLLLIIIEVAVVINCMKAAHQNPVDSLKKE